MLSGGDKDRIERRFQYANQPSLSVVGEKSIWECYYRIDVQVLLEEIKKLEEENAALKNEVAFYVGKDQDAYESAHE